MDSAAQRARDAWRRINDKPSEISILRNDTPPYLAAQTVRIEYSIAEREVSGAGATTSVRGVTVFGVQGHATVPDTDIERGDKFAFAGERYQVRSVDKTLVGEIQAISPNTTKVGAIFFIHGRKEAEKLNLMNTWLRVK